VIDPVCGPGVVDEGASVRGPNGWRSAIGCRARRWTSQIVSAIATEIPQQQKYNR
jgi:hypothetical protein